MKRAVIARSKKIAMYGDLFRNLEEKYGITVRESLQQILDIEQCVQRLTKKNYRAKQGSVGVLADSGATKENLDPAGESPKSPGAVFVGWQTNPVGEDFALYNIILPQHHCYGSTVTGYTLKKLGLPVPPTPQNPHAVPSLSKPEDF